MRKLSPKVLRSSCRVSSVSSEGCGPLSARIRENVLQSTDPGLCSGQLHLL